MQINNDTSALKRTSYVPEFESLRGLMALWVLLGHVATRIGIHFSSELSVLWKVIVSINIPVDIFIALSGFAIFTLLSKDKSDYPAYLLGRFFRIYPVYITCLMIGVLLYDWRIAQLMIDPLVSQAGLQSKLLIYQSVQENYWQHLLAHLLVLHGVIPDQVLFAVGHSFVAPAWSLSLEWQFYLLAPLLFFFMTRSKISAIGIGLSLIALDLALRWSGLTFSYGAFLPVKIGFFFAGMAVFFFRNDEKSIATILMGMALIQAFLSDNYKAAILSLILWLVMSFVILRRSGVGSSFSGIIRNVLGSDKLKYLGKLSFSMYLIHVIIIDIVASYLVQFPILDLSNLQIYLLLLIPTLLLTFLFSMTIHRLIEAPFIQLGKKFRK